MARGITVPEVFKAMGLAPSASIATAVGAAVREEYEREHGELPPKDLRPKTKGGGSHCFAIYPPSMRPAIERIIRQYNAEAERQGSLFH